MIEDKFSRVRAVSDAVSDERQAAKESSVSAIRKMLEALSLALNGSLLMGLPNLGRTNMPYRGIRALSCERPADALPRAGAGKDGRAVLCLSVKGELEYVNWTQTRSLVIRTAEESEYRAEWPEDVAEGIIAAVDCHLGAAGKAAERYAELRKLSDRLSAALSEGEQDRG